MFYERINRKEFRIISDVLNKQQVLTNTYFNSIPLNYNISNTEEVRSILKGLEEKKYITNLDNTPVLTLHGRWKLKSMQGDCFFY